MKTKTIADRFLLALFFLVFLNFDVAADSGKLPSYFDDDTWNEIAKQNAVNLQQSGKVAAVIDEPINFIGALSQKSYSTQ